MEAEAAFTVQQVAATAFLLYLCTSPRTNDEDGLCDSETNKDTSRSSLRH